MRTGTNFEKRGGTAIMAAGSLNQAVSPSHGLSEDDLAWVYEALYSMRAKYTNFGLRIDVKKAEIDSIQIKQADADMCLLEILSIRLKRTPALTWDIIDKALRSPIVGELQLAETLQETCGKSCDPSLSHPGFESTLDQHSPSQAVSPSQGLGENDLVWVYEALYPMRTKYVNFGLRIGVRKAEIDSIQKKQADSDERLREILSVRLKKIPALTWDVIDKSLRSQIVGELLLADTLQRTHYNKALGCPSTSYQEPQRKTEKECKEKRKNEKDAPTQQHSNTSEDDSDEEVVKVKRGLRKAKSGVLSGKEKGVSRKSKTKVKKCVPSLAKLAGEGERRKGKKRKQNIEFRKHTTDKKKSAKERKRKRKILPENKGNNVKVLTIEEELCSMNEETVSTEEKEASEPSDDSSSTTEESLTIFREVKKVRPDTRTYKKGKIMYRGKGKRRVAIASSDHEFSGDEESCPHGSNWDQPRKRSRKRCKERSMNSTAIESSFSSASLEEYSFKVKRKRGDCRKSKDRRGEEMERESLSSSTEMDDSSPERDMLKNISESETQNLRKIFKCAFGKLCCTITEPVKTAAELQGKRLVSISTMKDMLVSPESKQIKTIALVHALYRKIKSRSDRIFTVIEIFLKSEVLHEVGRKLWFETGTIILPMYEFILQCHEFFFLQEKCVLREQLLSLAVSYHLLLLVDNKLRNLPQLLVSKYLLSLLSKFFFQFNIGVMVPVSAKTATQDVTGEYISPPEAVRVSVSQPVLTQYGKYLRSCYKARPLAAADKYLPTLSAPYINLAMVSREDIDPEQRDEFTRQTLHGGVDEILRTKKPLKIEDLLTPEDSGRPVRFILVEGPPGIGKSTFAWEVCRRWDEIESLGEYQTVVLLKLREKWVLNATSLADLFRYPFKPEFSEHIAQKLHDCSGKNLLLVLDGFDEVSHTFHEDSVVKSILCKQLLPECTIILTTRPSAKSTLKSICQPQVDKHVEIIGFTEKERVKYINEVFVEEPELQANFLKYMFLVPHIKSMMYIPLNCAIIAQVYYESQKSCRLAIPKTRTKLYKTLAHSLLVRHMHMKRNYTDYTMLPEGLDHDNKRKFEELAKFAFNNYHVSGAKKVTFFQEDIPEGLVHFGFMNESTEMYAGKGVEKIFSFLHLSLQEYLAAWYLASSYSIEFQVAYHRLAVDEVPMYEGEVENEQTLISLLESQTKSLVEPAIFLAGVTGCKSQSGDRSKHWEMYLCHTSHTADDQSVLLRSLYEAQNSIILSQYSTAGISELSCINPSSAPYDCYALSYCLANSSDRASLTIRIYTDEDISLLETFVKGLEDHCTSSSPRAKGLTLEISDVCLQTIDMCMFWLKYKFLTEIEEMVLSSHILSDSLLQSFVKLQSLTIDTDSSITSWEWLASLKELKVLNITSSEECSPSPADPLCWPVEHKLTELVLNIQLPLNGCEFFSETDKLINSVLKSILKSNLITQLMLPNVCRATMDGVHSILLHCPSLETLELERTRLGYDGILYICSSLRKNTSLKHLVILDDRDLPHRRSERFPLQFTTFLSNEVFPLPSRTTCTDFLLELNNILKDNTTLEEMDIQSGLFLPLSADGHVEYCQWTGLGPLQQFNVGAVGSGMSPNLKRSFSISDLTEPQTTLFWDRHLLYDDQQNIEIDFRGLFLKKKMEGKKLFSLPSFTAPDTEVLQSFSGLDPRLKEFLKISDLHEYVEDLRDTYFKILSELTRHTYLQTCTTEQLTKHSYLKF